MRLISFSLIKGAFIPTLQMIYPKIAIEPKKSTYRSIRRNESKIIM